jgi:hypothetical protein
MSIVVGRKMEVVIHPLDEFDRSFFITEGNRY